MQDKFLSILFLPEEQVCFGADVRTTTVKSWLDELIKEPIKAPYVTINPVAHSRADVNVTSFRNILLELDKKTIGEQMSFLVNSNIPLTTIVFSGSKSLHAIVALENSLSGADEYKELVEDIYFLLDPKDKWLDKSCKNPSRFTRMPEVLRIETGLNQELLTCNKLIPLTELLTWMRSCKNYKQLNKRKVTKNATRITQERKRELSKIDSKKREPNAEIGADKRLNEMSRRAEAFFIYGADKNLNWRAEAFYACCEAARCNFELDEIYDMLYKVDGYLELDSERIPEDAYKLILQCGELGIKSNYSL